VGTTQPAIARLERGSSSPGFDRVADLVAACGLELRVSIRERPPDREAPTPIVPSLLFESLLAHSVRFVITGQLAAGLRGGPVAAPVPEICPDDGRASLEALCRALEELSARVRTADGTGTLPFDRTPETLLARNVSPLSTTEGDLDVVLTPPGTRGYRDLVKDAGSVRAGGLDLPTASLLDVVRELEAAEAGPELVHALRRLR
jgi:hypothetical protein